MKQIKRNLKQAMNALSAAHAGEMLHRRGKHRQLVQHADTQATPKAAAPTPDAKPAAAIPVRRKQVALWLKGLPSRAVLDYALSSCQRMDMDLLILHAGKPRAQDLLAAHGDRLESTNVGVDVQVLDSADESELFRHIERTPRIAFLVMGNADALANPLGKVQAMPPVPVVVLTAAEAKVEDTMPAATLAA